MVIQRRNKVFRKTIIPSLMLLFGIISFSLIANEPAQAGIVGGVGPSDPCLGIYKAAIRNPTVRTSYVFIDMVTSRTCELRAHESVASASLYQTLLMIETHRLVQVEELSYFDELVIMPWHGEFTPPEHRYSKPTIMPIGQALNNAIVWSANPEAEALHEYLGVQEVNQTAWNLGLLGTVAGPRYYQTTAFDQANILKNLYKGELISEEASSSMLSLLLSQNVEGYMLAGLPDGLEVAHKTGLIVEYANDAGLVYGPRGPFILVILTRRDDSDWRTFADAQKVMTDVAAAAYAIHGQ